MHTARTRVVMSLVLTLVSVLLAAAESPADLILRNGVIVTADQGFSIAACMAFRAGRIAAIGNEAAVTPLRGPATEIVDLAGACVLPGLIDSHCHPSAAAVAEIDHERPPMECIGDVLRYFAGRAAVLPAGEWIFLGQRFLTRLKEHRYPTREELDRAAPQHPVIFRTGPDCCVNSTALRLCGIDRGFTPTPESGAVAERDPKSGELTGVFRNMNSVFTRHVRSMPISPEVRVKALTKLLAAYNRSGLTGACDREVDSTELETYQALLAANLLTARVSVALSIDAAQSKEEIEASLARMAALPLVRTPHPMLRIVAVKTYLDGGMLTGSAYMSAPWGTSALYRISDPNYRGLQFIADDKLAWIVARAYAHGFSFVAHCQGDAAVDALLRAYEKLNQEQPVRDRRLCIGHGSFMRLDLIRRAAKIGVVADSQTAWLYLDASVLLRQFGPERLRYFIPLRTWCAEGGVVAGGSDHMIGYDPDAAINFFNPFMGMWVAITRRAKWVDAPVSPGEAISREQAILLYTRNAAFVAGTEKLVGSLEHGKCADCIVIDRNILTCPVDEIRSIQVERTYVDGKLVYAR